MPIELNYAVDYPMRAATLFQDLSPISDPSILKRYSFVFVMKAYLQVRRGHFIRDIIAFCLLLTQ